MTWTLDHWPALLLLTIYLAAMVRHAITGQRQTRGLADYYVGGRNMGGIVLGISFFATFASTNSFIGFSGQAYTWGAPWLLLTLGFVFFAIIAWLWVAPRLRAFTEALDSVTVPDFLGFRFASDATRAFAAVVVIFASILYMTAIFKGIGGALELYLDIRYETAVAAIFVVVVVYTAVGGFISVVRTDVVQGLIMIVAAVLMFAGTVRAAGGLGALSDLAATTEGAWLFTWNAGMPFPLLFGIMVAASIKFIVEPRLLSRFYALRDARAMRQGMWTSLLAIVFVFILLTPIGLYARVIFPAGDIDPDFVVPMLLTTGGYFHPALASFLLVAIVAAAMSSLDSVLLVIGTTCHRDIVSLIRPPRSEQQAIRGTRIYVVVFALVTALIALRPPGGIVTLTAFSGSLYAACFCPPLLFGLYWRQGNGAAALGSMITGLAVLLAWTRFPPLAGVHAVFPSVAASTLAYVVVARFSKPVGAPRVQAFFDGTGQRNRLAGASDDC